MGITSNNKDKYQKHYAEQMKLYTKSTHNSVYTGGIRKIQIYGEKN